MVMECAGYFSCFLGSKSRIKSNNTGMSGARDFLTRGLNLLIRGLKYD